ncbi:MAG: WD40 repeat domain-containing protein [Methylocystis sp.]
MTQESGSITEHVVEIQAEEAVVAAAFLSSAPFFALAHGVTLRMKSDGPFETDLHIAAHTDGAALCAASDGKRLFSGGDDGRIVEISAAGEVRLVTEESGKWIDSLALRGDGTLALTAGRSARARLPGGEIKSLDLPSTSRGVAFLPKGLRIAIAHYNGATLWYPNASAEPETLEWKGAHLDVTVSPDGRFVVTSMQENTLHGWRLADKKNMRMSGYPAKTRSFSWSPDGKWLATSGADACVLWPFEGKDGPMGAQPRECGVRAGVGVTRVAFHPQAPVVAIGYEDGMILMSRIADGSEILVRRPPGRDHAKITTLAWDAQGRRLAFGGGDRAVGLLKLPQA